ncbi:MAG: mechanosensitive ion channel domain-containing protein [Desulfoferrobacter sp.]
MSEETGLPSPDKTEEIDKIGTQLNHEIDGLGHKITAFADEKFTSYLGNWVNATASFGITWFTLIACALLIISVLVIERLLRALNRKLMQRISGEKEDVSLPELILAALARPISLFIWAYGLYAALTPLFQYFRRPDGTNLIQEVAHRITNVAGSALPFWFIFRFIGLLDDALRKRAESTGHTPDRILSTLMSSWRRPLKILFLIVWVRLAVPLFGGPELIITLVNYGFAVALIGAIAWLIIRTTDILEDLVLSRYRIDVRDNLEARKIHTQIRFLKRVIVITVFVVALASMLMLFQKVRQFGASILASAGVMGIVAGLAAQRSIANLLVGIQIAITQPIRVDDVVIVENEWGQIEEITSTYVVVRIWDLRRLILPITYFTEKPFQNWTRTSADLIGTVYLYADYSIPVEEVRQELYRIVKDSELWDGKAWALQVTDAKQRTIELRAIVSAANASAAWNLRCEVRERLIIFIQKNYPESLPKFRAELSQDNLEERPAFFLTEKTQEKS